MVVLFSALCWECSSSWLREYMLEKLSGQGELERLRDWHAWYYMRVAEVAELGLRGPQQLVWLARLKADRDNFRAALEWSLQRARSGMRISAFTAQGLIEECTEVADSRTSSSKAVPSAGLLAIELCSRLAAALRPYWEWQGYLVEARSWLGATLALPLAEDAGEMVLAGRAKALSEYSRLASLENDQTRAAALVEESIVLWQRLDDPKGLASALIHRAWAALAMSEYETARKACLEGLQYLTKTDDPWLRAQLLFYLGAVAGFTGDFEQMRDFYTQSRELFELVGDTSSVADVLKDHGAMMLLESKYAESIDYLLKSIQTIHYDRYVLVKHMRWNARGTGPDCCEHTCGAIGRCGRGLDGGHWFYLLGRNQSARTNGTSIYSLSGRRRKLEGSLGRRSGTYCRAGN